MKYYVIDAFAKEAFKGNPAGVCMLDTRLDSKTMQSIAAENNLAETAFVFKNGNTYDLCWYTPECEIDLCGHATLASAYVITNYHDSTLKTISFNTKSGLLTVDKTDDTYIMDFPSREPTEEASPNGLAQALGCNIIGTYRSRDLIVLLDSEKTVAELKPNHELLKKFADYFGIVVTAKGDSCDFVSRYFAPNAGIAEDPVTGSSHCSLIPFWSKRLGKVEMSAKQLSKRGGSLYCRYCGDRVKIGGTARLYLCGDIIIAG